MFLILKLVKKKPNFILNFNFKLYKNILKDPKHLPSNNKEIKNKTKQITKQKQRNQLFPKDYMPLISISKKSATAVSISISAEI